MIIINYSYLKALMIKPTRHALKPLTIVHHRFKLLSNISKFTHLNISKLLDIFHLKLTSLEIKNPHVFLLLSLTLAHVLTQAPPSLLQRWKPVCFFECISLFLSVKSRNMPWDLELGILIRILPNLLVLAPSSFVGSRKLHTLKFSILVCDKKAALTRRGWGVNEMVPVTSPTTSRNSVSGGQTKTALAKITTGLGISCSTWTF